MECNRRIKDNYHSSNPQNQSYQWLLCRLLIRASVQENNSILTDIPMENEILRISRGYLEETQNLVSSEYTGGIPSKYQSVGIFL